MRVLSLPFVALVLFWIGAGVPSRTAAGVGFTVNSTVDAVDAAPGDGACSTVGGACTLRAAVQETNALPGADEISLPAGTYQLTIGGVGEDAAATGDLDLTGDITIIGSGAQSTIIRQSLTQGRVMEVLGEIGVTLRGLAITSGDATVEPDEPCPPAPACPQFYGGGIYNHEGQLALEDIGVTSNKAISGGGIASYGGSLAIERASITDNTASSFGGGLQASNAQISQSLVAHNKVGFGGGGLALRDSTVENSTISENVSQEEGSGILGAGSTSVVFSTIAWNTTAASVSAVDGQVRVNSTIIVSELGNACGLGAVSDGFNATTDATCSFASSGDVTNVDPLLLPLGDYGGPTLTHALPSVYQSGDVVDPISVAIDGGDAARCPSVDQRGELRPTDGDDDGTARCDIGAYEAPVGSVCHSGCFPVIPSATPAPTPVPTPMALPKTGGRP